MSKPTSTPTLAQKVQQQISADILLGRFQPNQKLVVAELKSHYQTGASPIREALVQLAWQQYVVLEPQKGCRVAPVSREEFCDLIATLKLLLLPALHQSIAAGDEAWELKLLTQCHSLNRIDLQAEDFCANSWGRKRYAFCRTLFQACPSISLCRFIDQIFLQLARYRHLWLPRVIRSAEHIDTMKQQHEKILKAALSHDAARTCHEVEQQLDHYIDAILNVID